MQILKFTLEDLSKFKHWIKAGYFNQIISENCLLFLSSNKLSKMITRRRPMTRQINPFIHFLFQFVYGFFLTLYTNLTYIYEFWADIILSVWMWKNLHTILLYGFGYNILLSICLKETCIVMQKLLFNLLVRFISNLFLKTYISWK